MTDFLYTIKLANADYKCAVEVVQPYMKSRDDKIQATAKGAVTSYASLFSLNQEIMNEMKSGLDAEKAQPPGKRAERSADLRFRKNAMWKVLFDILAPLSTYVFPEMTEGPWNGRLRITSTQRRVLLEELEKSFGAEVKGGPQGGQTSLMGTASLLHHFLSDQRFRGSDVLKAK